MHGLAMFPSGLISARSLCSSEKEIFIFENTLGRQLLGESSRRSNYPGRHNSSHMSK